MCDYCEKVACGSCTNSNTSECLHGGKKSDSKSVIKEFGTEPYGNPNGFKLICCKCGKPAIIVPTHFYETQDTTAPDKITLELRCTCGNKYGATIHTKHGGGENDMVSEERRIKNYVERCVKDSFVSEDREYEPDAWRFEYILIRGIDSQVYQMYPVLYCKYARILRRVNYRLNHNIYKNFHFMYENTVSCWCTLRTVDNNFRISTGYTQAVFKYGNSYIILDIYDENTDLYQNKKLRGECILSYIYEKMLFKYYGLNAEKYMALPDDDERKYLPKTISEDWEGYKNYIKKHLEMQ